MKLKIFYQYLLIAFVWLLIGGLHSGCSVLTGQPVKKDGPALKKISMAQFPEFSDDMSYDSLQQAIAYSLAYLEKLPPTKRFTFDQDRFDTAHLIRSLKTFSVFTQSRPADTDLKRFISDNYLVYRSVGSNGNGRVLFTGYYEPILRGSLQKDGPYQFPVYAKPRDLTTINLSLFNPKYKNEKPLIGRYTEDQTVVPYYVRKEIETEKSLAGNTEVIAWVDNRTDLFFVQIQGSGKISLDNGDTINLLYHAKNGRPYRSIGRLLIEKEKIPRSEMSMQRIKSYLRDHPDEMDDILNYNPSYIFFRQGEGGPFGCYGFPVTPGRSLALEKHIFPSAALAFVDTMKPLLNQTGQISRWNQLRRFFLNHDTGGAIRGPGRADLFWGSGLYAETAAGHMKHDGRLYFLVLKPDSMPK